MNKYVEKASVSEKEQAKEQQRLAILLRTMIAMRIQVNPNVKCIMMTTGIFIGLAMTFSLIPPIQLMDIPIKQMSKAELYLRLVH